VTVQVEQLAALADGTLPERHRAALEAEVAGSPGVQRALADQQRVVRVLRAIDVEPPLELRERVEAKSVRRPRRSLGRRLI
jgi:hypothetical protein